MRLKYKPCCWVLAMIVVLAAGAMPARAQIVLGNLSSNDNNFSNVGQGLTAAMGFTMGNTGYSLTSAELVLTLQAPASDAPVLQLWSENSKGAPGASLLTFKSASALTAGTDETVTFSAANAFTLQANTTYFLYLTSSTKTGAFFQWAGGNPGVTPTGAGATYFGTTTGVIDNFQLNGTAMVLSPEPSSFLIVAIVAPLGGLGCWWIKRRRVVA
jgi:hypothetical protein